MLKKTNNSTFWSKDHPKWNFGDAIASFLYENLLIDFTPYSKNPWLIGSMLFDGVASIESKGDNEVLPGFLGDEACEAVFWGCGLRGAGSLSAEFAERSAVLGVRGPCSASDLKLGAETPMGDPAFFLPALYTPRKHEAFAGKSVCIPHYWDERADSDILARSGCDVVLRPAIEPNLQAVERFIDAVCSADFVLCGALHGAITAAAYGVPFGYWNSGNIDIPYKWEDFSASVRIPCLFHDKLADAHDHYVNVVRDVIRVPSMWPLLCVAPAFVHPSGLMKVLRYELGRREGDVESGIDDLILQLDSRKWHVDRLAELSRRITNELVPALVTARDEAHAKIAEGGEHLHQLAAELTAAHGDAQSLRNANGDLARHVEILRADIERYRLDTEQKTLELSEVRAAEALAGARSEHLLEEQEALKGRIASLVLDIDHLRLDAEQKILKLSEVRAAEALANARSDHMLEEKEALKGRIASLGSEIGQLKHEHELQLADVIESQTVRADRAQTAFEAERGQHASALLRHAELSRCDLVALQHRLDAATSYIGTVARRLRRNKWARTLLKLPVISKYDQKLREQTNLIQAFLAQFSDEQLGMPSEGREDRILAYLVGATSYVADFPLLDRHLYRALHPDVADVKIDPFVHYLNFGHREGRSPHPLFDYDYYTRCYPETGHFAHSALEHYVRFGSAKAHDPCELFSTSGYVGKYPDVKQSQCNPLLHYLRNPGCQPHPNFDSHFYRTENHDVVSAGINPLAHFVLHGRAEGRWPAPNTPTMAPPSLPPRGSVSAASSMRADEASASAAPRVMARSTSRRPLIVMIDALYPRPDEDSGSLDQVNFVRIFQALGYEVAFAALMEFAPEPQATRPLADLGVTCITAAEYVNIEEFVFLNAEVISAFFLSRFNFGGEWIERARTFCPHAQVILNTVDLHHVREERHARLKRDKAALKSAKAMKGVELARITAADVTIVVSDVERELLEKLVPAADVRVIPLIRKTPEQAFPPFEDRDGIAFIGGFKHQPNVDAVTTFLDTVWPELLAASPALKFYVIGSHMPDTLRNRQDKNVEWVGYVPELEPWLDKVRLTVAPLRYGAGAKGKVVSSLLNGVPCVGSQIATEGMGIADGNGVIIASQNAEYVRHILALHGDKALWTRTSQRGFEAVRHTYSIERGEKLVEQIVPRVSVA